MIKKILALVHGKDLDGIASAAIICRYAKKHGIPCKVYFTEPLNLHRDLEKLAFLKNNFTVLIIADLGLNKHIRDHVLKSLLTIKSRGISIFWFDHHVWNNNDILKVNAIIDKFINNTKLCAAEITYQNLLPNDEIAKKLALLARDIDFWIRREYLSQKLAKIINSNKIALGRIVDELSNGRLWNKEFEEIYNKVLIEEHKQIENALKSLETHKVGNLKIAIVKGNISAGLITDRLISQHYDIIVVISSNGKISLRRGNPKINLIPIAEKLHGGGHPFAAGGILKYSLIDKLLAKFLGIYRKQDEIIKAIKESVEMT